MTDRTGNILRDYGPAAIFFLSVAVAWGAMSAQINYLARGQDTMVARFDALGKNIETMSGGIMQAQTKIEDTRTEVGRFEQRLYAVESAKR